MLAVFLLRSPWRVLRFATLSAFCRSLVVSITLVNTLKSLSPFSDSYSMIAWKGTVFKEAVWIFWRARSTFGFNPYYMVVCVLIVALPTSLTKVVPSSETPSSSFLNRRALWILTTSLILVPTTSSLRIDAKSFPISWGVTIFTFPAVCSANLERISSLHPSPLMVTTEIVTPFSLAS